MLIISFNFVYISEEASRVITSLSLLCFQKILKMNGMSMFPCRCCTGHYYQKMKKWNAYFSKGKYNGLFEYLSRLSNWFFYKTSLFSFFTKMLTLSFHLYITPKVRIFSTFCIPALIIIILALFQFKTFFITQFITIRYFWNIWRIISIKYVLWAFK